MTEQITERDVRKIFARSAKILHREGKPHIDKRAALRTALGVAGKAFLTGGAIGAAGGDPQLIDETQFFGDRPMIVNGREVIGHELPTTGKNQEQAMYYWNLGNALEEYSWRPGYPSGHLQKIGEAFRKITGENACEYKTILELAYALEIITEQEAEYYRKIPESLARIDLGIRRALTGD